MQFIDLKTQYKLIKDEIDKNINTVLEHGRYVFGPEIEELESKLSEYVGQKHCLCCSSGTDALLIPLMAWGIGRGDAVFTTPFTFIATAEVIKLAGATPVFVDIDPLTYNIDPNKLETAINNTIAEGKLKPRAIIPVDLFGLPAEYGAINEVAEKYNLKVLEDAAQSFGAKLGNRTACGLAEVASTSFFPAKPLGAYGDGGAVFTSDDDLIEIYRSIRVHGMSEDRYNNVRIGLNARMDSIQAGVLLAKLKIFDAELARRQTVAIKYSELLSAKLTTPHTPPNYKSAWAQYSVLAEGKEHRASLMSKLSAAAIPAAIYYPIPLHLQTAFLGLGYKAGDFPVTETISDRIFSLPMHPYLKDEEIELVANTLLS